jgi:hypothetical protein
MRTGLYVLAVAAFGLLLTASLTGCAHHDEHPTGTREHPAGMEEHHEHPGTTHEQEHPSSAVPRSDAFARYEVGTALALAEHPEHPERPMARKPLTIADVADGIEDYILTDTELKGGYFLFYDQKDEGVLMLTLDKVHRERLAKTAPRTWFACSDFTTPEGKVYDIDFWLHQDEEGDLKVTEIMVHKEAGQPRYTWYEEDGTWKQRPVD